MALSDMQPRPEQLCEYCGKKPAVEFCTGCGKWVCHSPLCVSMAGTKTLLGKIELMLGRSA